MYADSWKLDQVNQILFVMIDNLGVEVTGLGNGFTLELSKAAAGFIGSAGTKAEISDGWYSYICTAAEADTIGPIALRVTGAGCIQQNLEYVIEERLITPVEFTYTGTDSATGFPIDGVQVWFTTDIGGINTVWEGLTDAFGVARDFNGNLPFLDPGTYYVWRQRADYIFADPDIEIVSL